MDEIVKRARELRAEFDQLVVKLEITEAYLELEKLAEESKTADFWENNRTAQNNLKLQAKLNDKILPFSNIDSELRQMRYLIDTGDLSLKSDLSAHLDNIEKTLNEV